MSTAAREELTQLPPRWVMHEILTQANQRTPHASSGHAHLGSTEVTACQVSSPAWWVYVWTFPTFSDLDTFTVHSQLQLANRSKASITNSTPTSTAMASSWELHKDTLRTLYVNRDETLKSIMAHMRDVLGFTKKYGIHPKLRSLTSQLTLLQQRPVRAAVQEMGLQQE
jgi:hypothetical protein